ncbi:hypothetical protein PAXRUDRAFT_15780 [Paxillus rubicundulus Ve08.2h10]|uniref:Unplaced genomic scaffold scaffold_1192, whole genome shotgun sequence n=1 Tax=Paxillus rubicundulus Ve08.2h10 TaxID=930991 RepID=A0A0D0DP03_9AGAM|nr:hypothetical protein PAXRUDRAFT_15780 [Paxillus rubicundulus Ve08.2h10]
MSSNTASADIPTCPTLIGPSNFQIMAKLWREKVLGVTLGTDTHPITSLSIPGTTTTVPVPAMSLSIHGPSTISPTMSGILMISGTATVEEVWKWTEQNKRAHGIIQDSINDALLLKMEMHTATQDLFDALLSIHQASNLASAFYIFQQLFNSTWSGDFAISEHIVLLTFILLNSLLKTLEWNMFTSSIINTIKDSKLTFNAVET